MTAVRQPEEFKEHWHCTCNSFVSHCQFYVYVYTKKYAKCIEVHNFVTYYVWKDGISHVVAENSCAIGQKCAGGGVDAELLP